VKFRAAILFGALTLTMGCVSNQQRLSQSISTAISEYENGEEYYVHPVIIDATVERLISQGLDVDKAAHKNILIATSDKKCMKNQSSRSFDKIVAHCPDGYSVLVGQQSKRIVEGKVTSFFTESNRESDSSWFVSFQTPNEATFDICLTAICFKIED
tara:strand:+ start:1757 stop:2227 length:471 start_codon:yes stop_codon:yes gene_type:complete